MDMRLFAGRAYVGLLILGCVTTASAKTITIENRQIRAEVDSESGAVTMRDRAAEVEFIKEINWPGGRTLESVRRKEPQSKKWGAGQGVVFEWTDGSQSSLTLYEQLPFAVVRDLVVNHGGVDLNLNRREMIHLDVSTGKPLDECRAFGTFGLNQLVVRGRDRTNRGSYNHLAIVDPESRNGVVSAWLTHERASGVLFYDRLQPEKTSETVRVTARQDYGRLRMRPGSQEQSEILLVGFFADARLGLEAYADAASDYYDIKLPPQPSVYCTWYHAGASDEKQIRSQTDYAAEYLKPYGFGVLQIDDKWQDGVSHDGPRRIFTRVRPDGPYPHGMKPTADYIKEYGLTPGLWFMPFAGTSYDPYFADKQHLFAMKESKPFEVRWGGTCLDLTNPEAQDVVRMRTQTICGDWGYQYIKIDGMWTGMATAIAYVNEGYKEDDLGETTLSDPDMTHVEAYRAGVRIVREAAGKNVFILGCNLAQNMRILGPTIGFVDAMRIGPDNGPKWSSMVRGPFSGSNLYFLHGRVWYNDPDPVYVRPSVPMEQARALVSWVTLAGQLHAHSFYYADLPPERLDLLKRAIPSHHLLPRPVDLFDERTPRMWLLEDTRRVEPFYVIGLFNWSDEEPDEFAESFARIGLPAAEQCVAFDYWANEFVTLTGDEFRATLEPATCRILAVRPAADRPQLISTSRHITQGVVDVVEEKWDAATNTLSGVSQVVGEPYELRIAKPAGERQWLARASNATLDGEDVSGGHLKEEELGWREVYGPTAAGELRWSIQFE